MDQERVYVCWTTPARYTLMAFDHDGNTVWEREGPLVSQHGGVTSPVLYEDKVILADRAGCDELSRGCGFEDGHRPGGKPHAGATRPRMVSLCLPA